jgi:hypothetical protein
MSQKFKSRLVAPIRSPHKPFPEGEFARFGLIDRRIREVTSPFDALFYACHSRLVNGYRAGLPEIVFRGGSERPRDTLPLARGSTKDQNRLIPAIPLWERLHLAFGPAGKYDA